MTAIEKKKRMEKNARKRATRSTSESKKLLGKLSNIIGKSSINQVRKDLGLGSHNTVSYWFKTGSIPFIRHEQVAKYINKKG